MYGSFHIFLLDYFQAEQIQKWLIYNTFYFTSFINSILETRFTVFYRFVHFRTFYFPAAKMCELAIWEGRI